jgi:ketosteroid isomerase-like protein
LPPELARRPEDVPSAFVARFNTGDLALVMEVYEDGAVFVPEPGTAVSGEELALATRRFLGLGLPISVDPRQTIVTGELALLIVDWVIDGTGPDGDHVHIEGTATDVVRRGQDGYWRYVIDNPFGTS